jgi:hypothetical protein
LSSHAIHPAETLATSSLWPIHAIEAKTYKITLGCFTLGVKANVQPKSSIPIGAKVEISPKAIILGIKAERDFFFSIYPKLLALGPNN